MSHAGTVRVEQLHHIMTSRSRLDLACEILHFAANHLDLVPSPGVGFFLIHLHAEKVVRSALISLSSNSILLRGLWQIDRFQPGTDFAKRPGRAPGGISCQCHRGCPSAGIIQCVGDLQQRRVGPGMGCTLLNNAQDLTPGSDQIPLQARRERFPDPGHRLGNRLQPGDDIGPPPGRLRVHDIENRPNIIERGGQDAQMAIPILIFCPGDL